MEFRDNKAIYLQIAEFICEKILLQIWGKEDKIPSVRELAVDLEVNPNTVMRTYELLQQNEIIYTKRGLGYFVTENGLKKAKTLIKNEFLKKDLPYFFKNLDLLGIDFDELKNLFETYKKDNL
jgi:GntR family transcriptional regulator